MKQNFLLFDVGGTKTRIAIGDRGRLGKTLTFPTPKKFKDGIKLFAAAAQDLNKGKALKGIVGGIRGRLDQKKTKTFDKLYIPNWAGKPLTKELKKALRAPVILDNDADLAGLGEAVYGAGKDRGIVMYMTISTGIGGVRIIKGKIDRGVIGFEPGKQIIDYKNLKTLEDYVSGTMIERRYKKKPQEIKSQKIWTELARVLAIGLYNTIRHWSPDIVILGGGVMNSIKVEEIKKYLKKIPGAPPVMPSVKKAKLGDKSGLYGALALTKMLK